MRNILLDTTQREYTWDGEKYPRVTSILACLAKHALVPAAVKATALHIESLVRDGMDSIDWIDVKREYRRQWDRKAADGTAVHLAIDAAINGQELEVDLSAAQEAMLLQFYRWQHGFAPEYLATEVAVFNETHNYAGTADFIARIGGRTLLVDTKTGADLWPIMALQLAAYGHAEFMVHSGKAQPLPDLDGWAVLHLRPEGFALREVKPDLRDVAWRGFLAARQAHTWMEGDGKTTDLVFDAPALPTHTFIPEEAA
jgi:hypothetical protein